MSERGRPATHDNDGSDLQRVDDATIVTPRGKGLAGVISDRRTRQQFFNGDGGDATTPAIPPHPKKK
jgi:hypothetical protein